MIRFCPSVTSFVVYARRCEKCCLFRVCDYIFKRCIDWCSWTENRHGSLWWGYWAAKHTAMRTSIRGRHSLMTTVVSLAEKERERERSVLENQRIEHSLSVLASQTTGNIGLLTLKRAIGMVMLVDNGATRHLGIITERIMFVFLKKRNFLTRYL